MFPAREEGENDIEEYEWSLPNFGLALYCLDIILKSIIWAGTHMVDRINSWFKDRQQVSGRVRGAERYFHAAHLLGWSWSWRLCRYPLVLLVSAWEKRKENSLPVGQ